jgi:hypothetical protein
MFSLSIRRSTLCILALCLAVTCHQARAESDRGQKPPAPKQPGLFDQFLQQVTTQIATAKPNPTLKLTASNSAPLSNQAVSVSASWSQSVSQPSYTFDWGDGTPMSAPGAAAEQEHVYLKTGSFVVTVRARATFDDRTVSTASRLVIKVAAAPVIIQQPPIIVQSPSGVVSPPAKTTTVTLHTSARSAIPNRPIDFTVAIEPPSQIKSFHYFFGDGTETLGPNGIAHSYANPGTYSPYVSTEPTNGTSVATSARIPIRITSTALPTLNLTSSTAAPVTSKELGISATLDPPDGTASYLFNWGDGSPDDTVDPLGDGRHTYSTPGSYTVTVTANVTHNGRQQTVTSNLTLIIERTISPLIPLVTIGLATLAGLGYLFFKPKVTAVYSFTTFDQPTLSVSESPQLSVSFRPGERPARHSIRIIE